MKPMVLIFAAALALIVGSGIYRHFSIKADKKESIQERKNDNDLASMRHPSVDSKPKISEPVIVPKIIEDTSALNPKPKSKMTRPEERGVDYSNEPTEEILDVLKESTDTVENRKLAKVLGDRHLDGTFKPSPEQQAIIDLQIKDCLEKALSKSAQDRAEGREQIERFWRLSAPILLQHLDKNDNLAQAELAAKSIILMRDKTIIESVIEQYKSASDPRKKQMLQFVLTKMNEQRTSNIPGRCCLDPQASTNLFEELVAPMLR